MARCQADRYRCRCVCVIDLVTIDTNYTQTAVFEKTRNIRRFFPQDEADITIGRRKLAYDRVVDLTRPVMQDARPSYYFNNIGGNHAAKPVHCGPVAWTAAPPT